MYNDCDIEQMEEMQFDKYEDGEIPSDSRGDVDSNEETGTRSEGDTKWMLDLACFWPIFYSEAATSSLMPSWLPPLSSPPMPETDYDADVQI